MQMSRGSLADILTSPRHVRFTPKEQKLPRCMPAKIGDVKLDCTQEFDLAPGPCRERGQLEVQDCTRLPGVQKRGFNGGSFASTSSSGAIMRYAVAQGRHELGFMVSFQGSAVGT
jgi:hypothetical protein